MNAEFGASTRQGGVIHRIRRIERGHDGYQPITWLCGARSINAVIIDGQIRPEDMCRTCNVMFSGAIVYRCYSADGHLLYIGSAISWKIRAPLHKTHSPWWPQVARVDKVTQPDLRTARRVEEAAIKAEGPLHNKVHNVLRFRRDGRSFVPAAGAA